VSDDAPTSATPAAATASGRPRPFTTAASLLVPLAWVGGFALLVVALVAGALHTLLMRESGTRWLLQQVPGLTVEGWQGALLGDSWRSERLRIEWDNGRAHAELTKVQATGLTWRWRPSPQAWLGLAVDQLAVAQVVVKTGPPAAESTPFVLPESIALPVDLRLAQARIGRVQVDDQPAATDIELDGLVVDPQPGGEHRVERLALTAEGVRATLAARIGTSAPLPLQARLSAAPAPGSSLPPWAALVTLDGPVRSLALQAQLQGPATADLKATLRPLEAWPVDALELTTRDLDLAALHAKAPRTRLSGEAQLRMAARDAPAFARIALTNAQPGRWDQQRLPLAKLTADLSGSLAQPDRLELVRAEAQLADGGRSAGRVQLQALWQGTVLDLQGRLFDVAPSRLDPRAPAMRLSGPLSLRVSGVPSPDPKAVKPATPEPPQLRWQLDLTGQLDGAPQPVRLTMEGEADERRLDVPRVRAVAGAAQIDAKLLLARSGPGERADWRLSTTGSIVDFDPLPWWPGEADSPLRRGPHRLSGGWQFDGRLPANAATLPALELLQRLAGNGRVRVQDSQLAGVPLAADITLGYTQAATPTTALLRGDLRIGGNQLRIEGRADPAGNGASDRWNAELQADALAGLAPLFALLPEAQAWAPRRGSISLTLGAEGRWPALRTAGTARISQLQAGALALAQGRAQWRLDTTGERSLAASVDLGGITYAAATGEQRADHLRATVDGTLASHRIDIGGAAPLTPPPMLLKLVGARAETGTRGQLVARGGWRDTPGGGGRWQARVERLVIGGWDGSEADTAPSATWLQASDLDATLDLGPDFALKAVRAGAGRVLLSDVLALRWDAVDLQLGASRTDLQLRADIEPFRLAPLLKRVQPGIGWEGDLRLAAKVDLRMGERMEADLVFERRDGDLHISSEEGLLLLGLTDARVGLTAREGRWTLTPLFRGRSLGEVSGSAVVVTTPESRRPPDASPLSGTLQARVADIGIWGPWVPAGWRLAGELRTQATLSGTLGQPRLTGDVNGSRIAVRNLLQGISVNDGTLAIKLDGDKARIEKMSVRSGDGKGPEGLLSVTGEAELGSQPRARLAIEANKFRVINRVDRTATVSGSAQLVFAPERGQLDGRFTVDEGLFDASRSDAPSLDDDVTVRRASDVAEAAREEPAPRRNFVLNLELDLGERLRVKGRGLDTGLRGGLKLSTPGGRLAINGSIRTDQGTYAAYGQKLEIERGIVTFMGPADDPRLDILALRPNIDVRVGVAITGNAQSPRVRLYSEPDMGETEKLSWLVLGRAPDGLGRNDTALLQRAAVALLSGEGDAPTDQLLSRLGIDDVSLRQGDTDVRETVVSLGKQLSRRWYLGYERGVNSTTGTWQLTYRIAQRFTLRAQSGLENSLDVIWTWRFQQTPADAAMRKSTVTPR
jgi:translocation and assembly module TamB